MPLIGRRRRGGGENLIDRDPQNLPVGIGGLRVVRRQRRTSTGVKWWRRNVANLIAGVGLIGAMAGAYLAASQPGVAVYTRGGDVYIGTSRLTLQTASPGASGPVVKVFSGDAVMIVTANPDHSLVAAASTSSHGHDVAGRCVLTQPNAGHLRETCDFWIGTPVTGKPTVTSVDVLKPGDSAWTRVYSDGQSVSVPIASGGGAWPIPVPVGR